MSSALLCAGNNIQAVIDELASYQDSPTGCAISPGISSYFDVTCEDGVVTEM